MKIKHFFVGAGLSLALALGVGAGVAASPLASKTVGAISGESTIYARGVLKDAGLESVDWSTGVDMKTFGGTSYNSTESQFDIIGLKVYTTDVFKFVLDGTWLGISEFEDGVDKSNFVGDGDIKVSKAAKYNFYVKGTNKIWANFVEWVDEEEVTHSYSLYGDRAASDWSTGFGVYDENAGTITAHLDAGEKFKIVADGTQWFGYSSLSAPGSYFSADGTNIVVNVSGTYVFTIPDGFYSSASGVTFTITPDVADGAYLRGDWTNGWTTAGQLAMTGTGSPFTISNVNLSGGSAVKMVYIEDGLDSWWGEFDSVESTDPTSYPVQEIDDGEDHTNAGVVSTGTYNITVTYVSDGKWKYTFEGTANEDLDDACEYARGFLSAMQSNCPYTAQDGSVSKVISTWSSQKTAFAALDENVKSYLTNKDSNVKDITDLFSSYDWIYLNYAGVRELTGADFLGRNPAVINPNNPASVINNTNNAGVVIAVITITSIVLVGGIFVIRRRKEQE